MMATTDSLSASALELVNRFCTDPTRAAHWRGLRKRYPLFAGDWPPSVPFMLARAFSANHRHQALLVDMVSDVRAWEPRPPVPYDLEVLVDSKGKGKAIDAFGIELDEEGEFQYPYLSVTAVHAALSVVIELAFRRRRDSFESWLISEVRGVLNSSGSQVSAVQLQRQLEAAASTAHLAARQHDPAPTDGDEKKAKRAREKKAKRARDDVANLWLTLGRQIGLIPSRRGGKTDVIADPLLNKVADEARSLLREIRKYRPTLEEASAVRELMLEPPLPAGPEGLRVTAGERVKKGDPPDHAYRYWDKKVALDAWCRRLAFPLLSHEELTAAEGGSSWTWLVDRRLDIPANRLSKVRNRVRSQT